MKTQDNVTCITKEQSREIGHCKTQMLKLAGKNLQ